MKYLIISIGFFFTTSLALCQGLDNYHEKVILNTDRSIYITGESIAFSATALNNQKFLSQILYIELITPTGKQMNGAKYKIEQSRCFGTFKIPENLYSGNYYVRAYTKFMRNNGPSSYDYQFIKIINPSRDDLLNENLETDSSQFKITPLNKTNHAFLIEIEKDTFGLREKIIAKISQNSLRNFQNVVVSVVPAATTTYHTIQSTARTKSSGQFFPETRGVSLSGLLKDNSTSEPLIRKKINLTIMQSKKNIFYSTFSDNNGNFYFAFPDYKGDRDIFISPEKIPGANPELLINNDFCTNNITLPNPPFVLSEKEQKSVYKLAINNQVYHHFFNDTLDENQSENTNLNDTLPFYGLATNTLKIDDYIALPTLKDYLTEISFPVKIKEKKEFKVIGDRAEINFYDPLIMVDFLPVYNIEHILEVSPQRLDRIEVVTTPYVKGDVIYGGIINFISVTNDLGGVKLPKSGMFLNYLFLENRKNTNPNYKTPASDLIPDTRNTLYWNPDLKLDSNSQTEISFYTGDTDENYIIKVVGITKKGEKIYSSKTFIVE
ncbi:MAG: hypothetical protein R6V23_01260 [Bacteroidales bacterium]